jgi:gliding motility-associated-like protein
VFPIPEFNIIDSLITLNVGRGDTLVTTNSEDIIRWQWSPARWLSCYDCPTPVATPKNNITYTGRVYNAAGCTMSDQVTIQVLCNGVNVYMPNTFTPNNDGMNDVFYPRGTGLFTIKLLRILNRWGQVVYEKTNFGANAQSEGWNGMFNGAPAEAGIYVYFMEVVCENNQIIQFTGNVGLLR